VKKCGESVSIFVSKKKVGDPLPFPPPPPYNKSPYNFPKILLKSRVNRPITDHLPMTEHLFISSSYELHSE